MKSDVFATTDPEKNTSVSVACKLKHISLINRQPNIIGVMGMEMEDVRDALTFMSEGRIDRKSLVTHSYPIGECGDAFEAQTNYADSVKVVLHPQE